MNTCSEVSMGVGLVNNQKQDSLPLFAICNDPLEATCWSWLEVDTGNDEKETSSTNEKQHWQQVNHTLFPFKLYDMLEKSSKEGFEDIVSWMPCGQAFRIHNQNEFQAVVMPNFFPGMTHYKSFRRQLNIYGITQKWSKQKQYQEQGPASKEKKKNVIVQRRAVLGIYSHPFLVRNKRVLCTKIQRRGHTTDSVVGRTTPSIPPSAATIKMTGESHSDIDRSGSTSLFLPQLLQDHCESTISQRKAKVVSADCYYSQEEIEDEIIRTFGSGKTMFNKK